MFDGESAHQELSSAAARGVAPGPRLTAERYAKLLAAARGTPPPYDAPAPLRQAKAAAGGEAPSAAATATTAGRAGGGPAVAPVAGSVGRGTAAAAAAPAASAAGAAGAGSGEGSDGESSSGSESGGAAPPRGKEDSEWVTVSKKKVAEKRPTAKTDASASGKGKGSIAPPADKRAPGGPLTHLQIPVGLEDTPKFRVVKRLLGPGGENTKRIAGLSTGIWVELRGTGTILTYNKPDVGPLVLHIKGYDSAQCTRSAELATSLIAEIVQEHKEAMEKDGGREPGLSEVVASESSAARSPSPPVEASAAPAPAVAADGEGAATAAAPAAAAEAAATAKSEEGAAADERAEAAAASSPRSTTSGGGWVTAARAGAPRSAKGPAAAVVTAPPSSATLPLALGAAAAQSPRAARPAAVACSPAALAGAAAAVSLSARPERVSASAPKGASKGKEQGVHRELRVGLEDSPEFRVARRIIGPSGENVKHIASVCPGTRLELRGEGTNPLNGYQSGPLVLHIRSRDIATADDAMRMAEELLERVRKERAAALADGGEERKGKGKGKGRGKGESKGDTTG